MLNWRLDSLSSAHSQPTRYHQSIQPIPHGTGMHPISMHLIGVYPMGVHLIGVHLTGQACIPLACTS